MIRAIINRRSVRKYLTKDIPDKYITELVKAAEFAPNSHHNRSWQFIVIRDSAVKKDLYGIAGSLYLKKAPVLIIPLIDVNKSGKPIQDLSVASQNILLQAVELGLGAVWKNIKEEKRLQINKLLGIPDNFLLINVIPIGYPAILKRPHDDTDFDINKIHQEKW
jgi:nitroreductase